MSLSNQSTGLFILDNELKIERDEKNDKVIAIGGNPNVVKSTIFNSLTGLNQHTGNWPGKTVTNAKGNYRFMDRNFILVDIPGTYSLMSNSQEEEIARDFICFGKVDATIIVIDATCLERNLNLVLQTREITSKLIVCVNLMDEAKRKNIQIDIDSLSKELGICVVATSAIKGKGLDCLMQEVYECAHQVSGGKPLRIEYPLAIEEAIQTIQNQVEKHIKDELDARWVALKLLDGNVTLLDSMKHYLGYDMRDDKECMSTLRKVKALLMIQHYDEQRVREAIVTSIVRKAEAIAKECVTFKENKKAMRDRKIDEIITSKRYGIPLMILMLGIVFWITIVGANIPSSYLSEFLLSFEKPFNLFLNELGAPLWLSDMLVSGVYRTLAWVVAVMLPPMAIFFPLFALLEDLGYLPRIAFNLDHAFAKAGACGKQALTMCMGFGCNAAGVIGCRIIDSKKERLLAILTNNFVPCNGRFPTLISIITMFFAGVLVAPYQSIISTLLLLGVILLGVYTTLLISRLLSHTLLKGITSTFILELPPYRKPQIMKTFVHSLMDRTLFVLGRAIVVAAPAGLLIYLLANIPFQGMTLLAYLANGLDPFARIFGLDGYILLAFILGFPANEIVIPILIMSYLAKGSLIDLGNLLELKNLLLSNGWTSITAICVMIFTLMHWPCATTLWSIKKETQSWKWAFIAFILPTAIGLGLCFFIYQGSLFFT